MSPSEQLDSILEEIDGLQLEQQASLAILQQNLADENIYIVRPTGLAEGDMEWLENAFLQSIFPGADAAVDRSGPSVPRSSPISVSRSAFNWRQKPPMSR